MKTLTKTTTTMRMATIGTDDNVDINDDGNDDDCDG